MSADPLATVPRYDIYVPALGGVSDGVLLSDVRPLVEQLQAEVAALQAARADDLKVGQEMTLRCEEYQERADAAEAKLAQLEQRLTLTEDEQNRLPRLIAQVNSGYYSEAVTFLRALGHAPDRRRPVTLPYERLNEPSLLRAVHLEAGEHLLVLQTFGWHLDGEHIPNAPPQANRNVLCYEHQWIVLCDCGPYIAVVRADRRKAERRAVREVHA